MIAQLVACCCYLHMFAAPAMHCILAWLLMGLLMAWLWVKHKTEKLEEHKTKNGTEGGRGLNDRWFWSSINTSLVQSLHTPDSLP